MNREKHIKLPKIVKTISLVGLMGCGKSRIGRLLAKKLGVEFFDADHEIEKAANCSINQIFARFGEAEFRAGEKRVIARLLQENPPHILATGGGAFIQDETRTIIEEHSLSIWLDSSLPTIIKRTAKSKHRPLLNQGNKEEILQALYQQRTPIYQKAALHIDANHDSPSKTVHDIVAALHERNLIRPDTER